MYDSFYGFSKRAFPAVADRGHFYPVEELVAARETLARVIQYGEGPALVVGPPGVGKTLLCTLLDQQFRNEFSVVTLACGQFRQLQDMLQSILHQVRLPYRGLNEGELRLTLLDFLEPSDESPNGLLLLVDEAQHLSIELLEEVRMICNFVRSGAPRVRAVLLGSEQLEERFTSPKLESFNQRLAARVYLQGMDREETRHYVCGLTSAAGGQLGLWSEDALRAVYDATDGVPRLINQVCSQALLVGAKNRQTQIEGRSVEEAWAELQQLPTPWNADPAPSGEPANVIEFGSLDEETAETAETAEETVVETAANEPRHQDDGMIDIDFGGETIDARELENESIEVGPASVDDGAWAEAVTQTTLLEPEEFDSEPALVQYELSPEAVEQAELIERRLEAVERACGETEPPPPTEMPRVPDPFGSFSEEEVVLDQPVNLGQSDRTTGPRVSSMESQLLAETLINEAPPAPALREDAPQAVFLPTADTADESYEPATVVPMFAASRDDREIIIIEEDPVSGGVTCDNRSVIQRLRGD